MRSELGRRSKHLKWQLFGARTQRESERASEQTLNVLAADTDDSLWAHLRAFVVVVVGVGGEACEVHVYFYVAASELAGEKRLGLDYSPKEEKSEPKTSERANKI